MIVTLSGLVGLYLQNRGTKRTADETKSAVSETAEAVGDVKTLSTPTGNGFASRTEAALQRIVGQLDELKDGQHDLRQRLDQHIGDHASADVRRQQ